MLTVGTEQIKELFLGPMGVKTALVGTDNIYDRPGAYVYIELNTKESE